MHNFRKNMAVALAVVALAPAAAFADTSASAGVSADVQAQIQALLTQIKTLQTQIKTLVASSTGGQGWMMGTTSGMWNPGQMGKAACVTIARNLKQGDRGDDVKNLQQMLKDDSASGFMGSVTGFFGPLTAKAMTMFQMHNGIASSSDGSVGPLTRGFFERRCGNGLDNKGPGMGKMQGSDMMWSMIRGTVTANNTSSITIQTNGGTMTANISASTTIKIFAGTSTAPTAGTISDASVGKTVTIQGKRLTDTTMDALNIGIGDAPMMKMEGGMGDMMDDHGGMRPMGMMPTTNGPQHGPGTNGGPQNW